MNNVLTVLISNKRLQLIFRLILGVTFIYASLHKIVAPDKFAQIIYGYGLFPESLINILAIVLPFLELFCGLLLVFGIYSRPAILIINFMLVAFILAISINLIRGHEFDCGCFAFDPSSQSFSPTDLLIRDIFFLIIGILVFLSDKKKQ